jgi:hypothetical protein
VYRLTEEGRGVAPVLRALARFGVQHLDGEPTDTMDARRVVNAMLMPWRQRVDAHLRLRVDLGRPGRVGGDRIDVVLDGLATRFEPAAEGVTPDVELVTTAADLLETRHRPVADLDGRITGDQPMIDQVRRAFALDRGTI